MHPTFVILCVGLMGKVRELLARTSGARASIPHTCPRPSRPLATTDGMNTCGRVAGDQTEGVIYIMLQLRVVLFTSSTTYLSNFIVLVHKTGTSQILLSIFTCRNIKFTL